MLFDYSEQKLESLDRMIIQKWVPPKCTLFVLCWLQMTSNSFVFASLSLKII